MALSDPDRLREEDPFTGQAIVDVPTHVIAGRSRFEVDLNRAEEIAVYRTPDQSWGMKVWSAPPGHGLVKRSLANHRAFSRLLGGMLDATEPEHGPLVPPDRTNSN